MKLFEKEINKQQLFDYIGDLSQVAGIKSYVLNEGKSKGVNGYDIRTGTGFQFSVIPDRALDIAWMEFKGMPISYIAKSGIVNPQYYDSKGDGWLKSFFAGALTTCGLTHVGPPEVDEEGESGLHGTISNIPAYQVCSFTEEIENGLKFVIKGSVSDSTLFSHNLVLTRTIEAKMGENKLIIKDRVVNTGRKKVPFMILYHINLGFPLISEDSRLIAPIQLTTARDNNAQSGIDKVYEFEQPVQDYNEQVFFHNLKECDNGQTTAGIVNESLNVGFYIIYDNKKLPYFTQWKMMGKGEYVTGLEPGNCLPIGRKGMKKRGDLKYLAPSEVWENSIELGVLASWEDIQIYKDTIKSIMK